MKQTVKILVILIVVSLFLVSKGYSGDKCDDFTSDVRSASIQYLGLGFPYWYNIGCMKTESNCKSSIVSFDGGIGLFQFTPSTGITAEIRRFIPIDPYNAESSIRAQAFYISRIKNAHFKETKMTIHKKYVCHPSLYGEKCGLRLADVYRFYNGGYWFFYESERGNFACTNDEIRKFCVRGGTWVGTGKNKRWLSFCDVNYSYPEKIFKYAKPYVRGKDSINFW